MVANNPEQAVSDLAQAMATLGTNSDLRLAMGEAGRQHVWAEYIREKGNRPDALDAPVLNNSATPASRSAA